MDPLSAVVDEVALEGLDGITIPSLWIRLENRRPKFPLKLDDATKGFLWKSLVVNEDLSFYALPESREDVELFDRFSAIEPGTGYEIEEYCPQVKDIYPIHVVPDNSDGLQGSCAFFSKRKDITKQVRSKSFTLLLGMEEALERYGRRLVVVASQALRFRTLIGNESDPDLKLSCDSFCVLERVARARWQGEVQRDLHRGAFKSDARKFHYLRKSLVRHQLITMQSYVRRTKCGQNQNSVLLLLKRFHVNRRYMGDILMENASNFLQQLPDKFTSVNIFKEQLTLDEVALKRLCKSMRFSKLVEVFMCPLDVLDPSAEPRTTKKGTKIQVRCIKLLKPYSKKSIADDEEDDDDDEEEDYSGERRGGLPSEGRIMERDVISQAYDTILSCGTKRLSQKDISIRMNIGKLESRMVCRKLERDGVIKGFMEDEGRQRTRKFLSHKSVEVSNQLQLFVKEQEKNQLLHSSAPVFLGAEPEPESPKTSFSKSTSNKRRKKPPAKKSMKKDGEKNGGVQEQQMCDKAKEGVVGERVSSTSSENYDGATKQKTQTEIPIQQSSKESESEFIPEQEYLSMDASLDQTISVSQNESFNASDNLTDNKIVVVDSVFHTQAMRSHQTYRLLKRKNLIVEAVQKFKIIEGIFPLLKIICEEEKQDGVSTKCCKKSVLRLIHVLSKEGLLKYYKTTVIQDGISKLVDIITHPLIQPNDERISQLIQQIRFKISGSLTAIRQQSDGEITNEQQNESQSPDSSNAVKTTASKETEKQKQDKGFKPTRVPGLGKSFGFQPKMHRLRVIHTFLWHTIYGHPLQQNLTESDSAVPKAQNPEAANAENNQNVEDTEMSNMSRSDEALGEEDEKLSEIPKPDHSESNLKVYVDEDSWKRFIPPVKLRKGFKKGWAMVGDLLLCLPLSVFVQFIQINYKVDGLEEFLNDPVKQHYLVGALPGRIRTKLLYKRVYIHMFHQNLQKLTCMGLVSFGVVEKFKDKDQVFVYLKHNATIVDTTTSEPHYWLVQEPPGKPFVRRRYTFHTAEAVENYWFDLMCVCLNTPLGVIRCKRKRAGSGVVPLHVSNHKTNPVMEELLKGSYDVCDDGSIPGDGKGAGGLDSEFFSHLKRNWLWTNQLLTSTKNKVGAETPDAKMRLQSLLSKTPLNMALKFEEKVRLRVLTNKQTRTTEKVMVGVEPASRNKQVIGGKGMKRKKKKETVTAPPKKRKEPKKRMPAHDAADQQALKRMTRQRVYWSAQEDSVMMLCSVASQLLDSKLKRHFVPYCIVRDLLHELLSISKDKTSVSVGRRTRYILKNPQTLLNYRICLAEVQQDKPLVKLLEENKPADPENVEDCAKAFSTYVQLLRQKFSSLLSNHDMIIPDSQREIFSRYKVSAIDAKEYVPGPDIITCKEDIHGIVLHNLIQSSLAMTNGQMKPSRSFQTFHTYSKYSQDLLCKVFLQSKKKRLFNRRRVNKTFEPKKNRGLPILPMSFQMSQSYYRYFSWRFPPSLCTDSFSLLRSLLKNGRGDEKPAISFYHEKENRLQDGEEAEKSAGKDVDKQVTESHPSAEDGDSKNEKTQNQSKMPGEKLKSDRNEEQSATKSDAQESTGCLPQSESVSPRKEQRDKEHEKPPEVLAAGATSAPAADDPPAVSDMVQFSLESPGGFCTLSLSLMTLGLLSVHVSVPKRIVIVDSSLVEKDVNKSLASLEDEDDEDDDDDGVEAEVKKKLQASQRASHTKYLLMRGYSSPGIVQYRNLSTTDNIVVESCMMWLRLRETPVHSFFSEPDAPPLHLTEFGPSLVPSILTRTICSPSPSPLTVEECDRYLTEEKGYLAQDVEACALLRRALDEAGENGLDDCDLRRTRTHLQEAQCGRTRGLQQYLKDLEEAEQVLRVGGMSVRWVLMQHAEPWLLTVSSKQQPRPHSTSERCASLNTRHNIPFARKRRINERLQGADEVPAKKLAVDGEKASQGEAAEKPLEEELAGQKQELVESGRVAESASSEKEQVPNPNKENEQQKDGSVSLEEECSVQNQTETGVTEDGGSADSEENIRFISRPWRFIDGKLNRQVCKGILEAVLFHVMSHPGLTQEALLGHYKDTLLPVAVMDVMEALIEIGCVKRKTLLKDPKPSLFGRPSHGRSGEAETSEERETVYYEPTISCCVRLCRLLPNERHWNNSM